MHTYCADIPRSHPRTSADALRPPPCPRTVADAQHSPTVADDMLPRPEPVAQRPPPLIATPRPPPHPFLFEPPRPLPLAAVPAAAPSFAACLASRAATRPPVSRSSSFFWHSPSSHISMTSLVGGPPLVIPRYTSGNRCCACVVLQRFQGVAERHANPKFGNRLAIVF